ncbi:MAG: single-stranded DNA-binding protein [Oscillospiraceae bacterium]|nr:single-stranded DNA-binding protein [Oscillospiraceae bacterium]
MLNRIILMGRLTRDPELRHTGSGVAVASFSLAVDRDFKDKTTGQRTTDFIDVVAWRQTGEFVSRYFQKGSLAVVEGRLQMRDWQDKDGNKRRSAEVVADNVYFGSSRRDSESQGNSYGGGYGDSGYAPSAPSSYAPPASQGASAPISDFAELTDDDGDLPF